MREANSELYKRMLFKSQKTSSQLVCSRDMQSASAHEANAVRETKELVKAKVSKRDSHDETNDK